MDGPAASPASLSLPADLAAAQAMILAARQARIEAQAQALMAKAAASSVEATIAHLKLMIEKLRRELYGQRTERTARLIDQMELALEELETADLPARLDHRQRHSPSHRSWLRLVIAATSNAFKRVRVEDADPWRRRRHIIIDEFPALGSMSFVENDIAVARGYDIQYHLLVQSLIQFRDTYSVNRETFIADSLVQAFGMHDMFTAEYFSKMMGVTTVTNWSDSQSTSRSHSSSWQGLQGSSSSRDSSGTSSSTSRSDVGRPLRTPDELRTMPAAMQVLFLRGMSPIQARLNRLDEMQQ